MTRWLGRGKELAVSYGDRCARVCDAGCRSGAARELTVTRVLRAGVRLG